MWRFLRALSRPARIIAAVSPLLALVAGLAALAAGVLVLRTFGPRFRVGRLLATTPDVSVAEARELAFGRPQYIRVSGRIDAEDDFEDDAHRPLVFRRTRLQVPRGRGWVAFEDGRERVRFEIRDGLEGIVVDDAALDSGLVVVPRESVGIAADLTDRVPARTPPGTPVRLLVEQVSSVEHAIVLGVPRLDASGEPQLSAGLGRPLVLTTLEPDEAMRVLTGGDTSRPLIAVICFVVGLVLLTLGFLLAVAGAAL